MSSSSDQKIWDELMNSIDKGKRDDYIPLNFFLPTEEPAINNTNRMNELRESVHSTQTYQDCGKTLYAHLVSSFYRELEGISKYLREGQFRCRGIIRCRLSGTSVVKLLSRSKILNLTFTTDAGISEYYAGNPDLCVSYHRY